MFFPQPTTTTKEHDEMAGTFEVDEQDLRGNAVLADQYADDLRDWADHFDDPQWYEQYAQSTGPIGAPVVAAQQQFGQLSRDDALALADVYAEFAQACRLGAGDTTTADSDGAEGMNAAGFDGSGGTHAHTTAAVTPDPGDKSSVARYIYNAALDRGYSPEDATAIVAYSVGESGLNPTISGGVQGDGEVIGLFQEKAAFAEAGGVDPSARYTVEGNVEAYLNQLEAHRGEGDIFQSLLHTSVGGPMYTGGYAAMTPLMEQARSLLGGSAEVM